MKDNYRETNSCFNCKFHIHGEMIDWPTIFCNFDNSFEGYPNIFSASDDQVSKELDCEGKHAANFTVICDDYKHA